MRRVATLLAALLLAVGTGGCTGVFFQPSKQLVYDPRAAGFTYRSIDFAAADGTRLNGWLFPAVGERLGSLLFLHGNAENISTHFANVAWLSQAGFDVFAFDYRGYGRSAGTPSLAGLHLDAAAALKRLIAMPDIEPEDIVVFGQSLGGAIALAMVAASPEKNHLAAIAVEGAFAGYRELAREKLAASWLTWALQAPLGLTIDDGYNPKAAAAALAPLPLLVIHGEADQVVPLHHGLELFEAAGEPKTLWRLPDTGHIQAFATLALRNRFLAFLKTAVGRRRAVRETAASPESSRHPRAFDRPSP